MSDIFLSYSREDLAKARHFAQGFEREGLTVWWDQALDTGVAFDRVTEKALEEAKAVVVLWSKHSVDSRWVRAEATLADDNGKLIPVTIEPCKRPIMFHLTQTADLSHWKGDTEDASWRELVSSLRRTLGKGPSSRTSAPIAGKPRKTAAIAITVSVALVIGLVAFTLNRPTSKPAAQTAETGTTQVADAPVTLAVLPFANLSSDPEQEIFSDGLTGEILNQLAQIKGLLVTGRTSSFSFKGKNEDLRVIAEKLGVAKLLEGDIRKDGDQLRITAKLIDGKTGGQLWSNSYNREKSGVFDMQEEVARDVAKALSVKLEVGELVGRPGMTRNIEAYDAYLAAEKSDELTPESLRAAIDLLERATATDPTFVIAWASLGDRYAHASSNQLTGNTPEGWAAKSDNVIERIKGISDYGQQMHEWLAGDRSQHQWDMVGAQKHFENARAIARNLGLGNAPIIEDAPVFVVVTGRFREAISLLERWKVADPLNPFVSFLLGRAYAATGNLQAAIAEEDRGLQLDGFKIPLSGSALLTALATRDRKLIEQRMALAAEDLSGKSSFSTMQASLDNPSDALVKLRGQAAATTDLAELSSIAVWIAWLGDPAAALDIYRNNAKLFRSARRGPAPFDIWNPVMHDMRQLPGFKDLARDMGLVEYWRTYGWGDLCKPVGQDDFECS